MATTSPATVKPGKRAGRPATGRSTTVVSIRLPHSKYAELKRRAERRGFSPTRFAQIIVERELKPRPGPATRRQGGKGKGERQ